MFINVVYKDAPELSSHRFNASEVDPSTEKILLVNPDCPVRVMLEYIRKKCRLGIFTQFDLCDETGGLKGLFSMPTYAQATDLFEHKKTYYIIVLKNESDKQQTSVIPQVNRENHLYEDLTTRVKRFLVTGDVSPIPPVTPIKATPTFSSKTEKLKMKATSSK